MCVFCDSIFFTKTVPRIDSIVRLYVCSSVDTAHVTVWRGNEREAHDFNENSLSPCGALSSTHCSTHIAKIYSIFIRCCRQFLSRVADVLEEYVGAPLSEDFLKAHFVSVHEVVEEMMDGGIPLVTEPNALKV